MLSETSGSVRSQIRIGQGFDVHPYDDDPARVLVLAGVRFDGETGLQGHSDADVIAHACVDALLGAAGLGDIGTLFPDTDGRWAGSDSVAMLVEAARHVTVAGWEVVNLDCTVILDRPRLAPHRDTMSQNLARAVGAPVSIKAKRTEGVAGLAGGVQCHAVALLQQHGREHEGEHKGEHEKEGGR